MDARKIACYYGVAPFGKESGTSVHSPAHTSHFANKLIKSLLGQAAQIARIYNPEIREYFCASVLLIFGETKVTEKGRLLQMESPLIFFVQKFLSDSNNIDTTKGCLTVALSSSINQSLSHSAMEKSNFRFCISITSAGC